MTGIKLYNFFLLGARGIAHDGSVVFVAAKDCFEVLHIYWFMGGDLSTRHFTLNRYPPTPILYVK